MQFKRYFKYVFLIALALLSVQTLTWYLYGSNQLMSLLAEDIRHSAGKHSIMARDCGTLDASEYDSLSNRIESEFAGMVIRTTLEEFPLDSTGRRPHPLVCVSKLVDLPGYSHYRWGVSTGNLSGHGYKSRYAWVLFAWIEIERRTVTSIS